MRDISGSSCHLRAHCINTDAPPSFLQMIDTSVRRSNAMLLQMLKTDERVIVEYGPNWRNCLVYTDDVS